VNSANNPLVLASEMKKSGSMRSSNVRHEKGKRKSGSGKAIIW